MTSRYEQEVGSWDDRKWATLVLPGSMFVRIAMMKTDVENAENAYSFDWNISFIYFL